MRARISIFLFVVITSLGSASVYASDLGELLDKGKSLISDAEGGGLDLDSDTIVKGLKEALEKGTSKAVSLAGVEDGYFENPDIKIPLPKRAAKYGKKLKKLGLGKYVDELEESINRAAEKAAPLASSLFLDAVKGMSIGDAKNILNGPDDAATRYFQENTSEQLATVFRPSIDESLSDVGAIKAYKSVQKRAGKVGLGDKLSFDMSDYVTGEALNGLFQLVADEEKNIRENPTARTTELLQQVFE